MAGIRVFTSYDTEHDRDLYDRMLAQSLRGTSRFEITACSEGGRPEEPWIEKVRRRIRGADQVIVICGEHTDASERVSAELRIAQQEERPYFLLWGRRNRMCTRPVCARADDGMYRWTEQTVHDQLTLALRSSRFREVPADCKRQTGAPRGR